MSFFTIIFLLILLAALACGWTLHRRDHPAAPAVLAPAALALIALALILIARSSDIPDLQLEAKEIAWADIRAQALATHIATTYPNQKILVILPFDKTPRPQIRDATIVGLQTSFDAANQTYQTLNPPMPSEFDHIDPTLPDNQAFDNTPSLDQWYTAQYLDDLLQGPARGQQLVLILPGMPHDALAMNHWRQRVRPLLAIGPIRYDIENTLLSQGKLAAAIGAINLQNHNNNTFPDKNPTTAFQSRYQILTSTTP